MNRFTINICRRSAPNRNFGSKRERKRGFVEAGQMAKMTAKTTPGRRKCLSRGWKREKIWLFRMKQPYSNY